MHEPYKLAELGSGSDPERLTRGTYDCLGPSYFQATLERPIRKVFEDSAQQFAAVLKPNSRILLVGCGDGRDAAIFRNSGHRALLSDYSVPTMGYARSQYPELPAVAFDFRLIPLIADSVDAVWASCCLYHVRKKFIVPVLRGCEFVLRSEGLLYFNLKKGRGERLDTTPPSFPTGGPRFYAFYGEAEVQGLISGFHVLNCRATDPALGGIHYEVTLRKR